MYSLIQKLRVYEVFYEFIKSDSLKRLRVE